MAGEGDTERLIVLLEARLTDFERNMLKAAGVSQKNFNAIKKESKSATRQMEQDMIRSSRRINQALASTSSQIGAMAQAHASHLGPLGAGLTALGPAGLAAAAGIGALVIGLGKGISSAAEAERIFRRLDAVLKLAGNAAGLTAGEIDGFAGELERATGIAKNEINAAAAALATYTNISGERFKGVIKLSTDMVAVYGGNLREWSDKIARAIDDPIQGFAALKRAGFQLTDAQLETVEAMRKVGDVAGYQTEMINILSDSLGGAAGAENKGAAGAAGRATRAIGAFFEELSRWTGVGPATTKVLNGIAAGLEHVVDKAERMRKIELDVGINVVRLNSDLAQIEDRLAKMEELRIKSPTSIAPDQIEAVRKERDRIASEIEGLIERGHSEVADAIAAETGERIAQWGASTDLIKSNAKAAEEAGKSYQTTQERLAALGVTYQDTQSKIEQARELWKASAADLKNMSAEEKAAYEERGAAIEAWAKAEEDVYQRQQASLNQQIANEAKRGQSKRQTRDEVKALISELEHELSLIGQTPTAQRIANEVRRLGTKATKEQREEIERLITKIDHETEALRKREEAQRAQTQAIGNLFKMGQDGLAAMVSGSESASEAIKKLAIQIAMAAAEAALLGTGPLGGLFGGGLFAPAAAADPWAGLRNVGFSSGTANTGGQRGQPRGIVHGQEAVIPLPNGGKVPVQMQGGGSGGGPVKVVVNNYGEPADVSVNQRTDADGSRVVEVMLQKKIQDEVTRPSAATNRQLRGAYGLSSQVIRR